MSPATASLGQEDQRVLIIHGPKKIPVCARLRVSASGQINVLYPSRVVRVFGPGAVTVAVRSSHRAAWGSSEICEGTHDIIAAYRQAGTYRSARLGVQDYACDREACDRPARGTVCLGILRATSNSRVADISPVRGTGSPRQSGRTPPNDKQPSSSTAPQGIYGLQSAVIGPIVEPPTHSARSLLVTSAGQCWSMARAEPSIWPDFDLGGQESG